MYYNFFLKYNIFNNFLIFFTSIVLFSFSCISNAFVQEENQTELDYRLFNFPVSTRSMSMAHVFSSIADDDSAMDINPSGMVYLNKSYFSMHFTKASHNRLLAQISFVSKNKNALAYHISNRAYFFPDQLNTVQFELNSRETLSFHHNLFYFGFAQMIHPKIALGGNINLFYNEFKNRYIGIAGDVGLMTSYIPFLKIGVVFKNLIVLQGSLQKFKEIKFYSPYHPFLKLALSTVIDPNWSLSIELIRNLKLKEAPFVFGIAAYIKLWKNMKGTPQNKKENFIEALDKYLSQRSINNLTTSSISEIQSYTNTDDFDEENLYLNFGLNSSKEIAVGLTLKLHQCKLDIAYLLKNFSWDESAISLNIAIPFL